MVEQIYRQPQRSNWRLVLFGSARGALRDGKCKKALTFMEKNRAHLWKRTALIYIWKRNRLFSALRGGNDDHSFFRVNDRSFSIMNARICNATFVTANTTNAYNNPAGLLNAVS